MSQALRVMIVEDEPLARASLRSLLALEADVELVGECANGREALERIRALRPELVFLDVHMPELDGLALLAALAPDERPAIVLTTAYDRYAVRAFEEEAVDYLLKPFSDERFRQALERARVRLRDQERRPIESALERLASQSKSDAQPATPDASTAFPERLPIQRQGSLTLFEVARLVWVEAADQYVLLHTDSEEFLMRESMGELERTLDPAHFLRVHRSAIVRLARVARLETHSAGTGRLLLANGAWIPVSRTRVPTVRRRLGGG
jgi:two-component system LytT family response regulator